MNVERFNAIRRVVLGSLLVYLLWGVAVNYFGFGAWLFQTKRTQDADLARQLEKLSAPKLEAMLQSASAVPPDSHLQCTSAPHGWDYVCSYQPTPAQSQERLRFGVTVDSRRWVDISRIVPMEADVPPPSRR